MPQITQSQLVQPPFFGYDTDVAHTLSAAGWTFDGSLDQWRKGRHAISIESLHEVLRNFHGMRRRLLHAFRRGVIGFTFDVEQEVSPADVDIVIKLRLEWPDAVTRLGAIDA